jgi:hypothetical protein
MRSRQCLSKFLLRRGACFPCRAWTQPHERWLAGLRFDDVLFPGEAQLSEPPRAMVRDCQTAVVPAASERAFSRALRELGYPLPAPELRDAA